MEQLDFITKLLGIKDQNIKIDNLFDAGTHKEILAHLDYDAPPCPACKGQMPKYDFQKPSKIPYLETAGYKTLIRLKKRLFCCKNCGKWLSLKPPSSRKITRLPLQSNKKSLNY